MSLAVKYRPSTWEDVTEQTLIVNILKSMCDMPELPSRMFLFIGPQGVGKAQPLYSKILTPEGFIEMRDVKVGTRVFTSNGNIGQVSGVYPQGVRPIYEITLQDRTKIRVSDEHLNVVYRYNYDKKRREDLCVTTVELLKLFNQASSKSPLRIDIPEVDWQEATLPIDPYLLGALIGDGSLSNNFQFSNSEADVVSKVDSILRRDWGKMLKKCPGDNVDYDIVDIDYSKFRYTFQYKGETYNTVQAMKDRLHAEGYPEFDEETIVRLGTNSAPRIQNTFPELIDAISVHVDENYRDWTEVDPLRTVLRELGVMCKSTEKCIPHAFLFASKSCRLSLLQGLIDTDGYIDKSGAVTFTTCSPQLSANFAFLVRSLGVRDTVVSHPAKYRTSDGVKYTGSTAYDHNLKISDELDFCTSEKHRARRTTRQCPPMRNIVSIEYVGDEECQCIMVDHPDHTYISEDGFIPTHNTTSARIAANYLNEGQGEPIEIDAASYGNVDSIRDIVKQAQMYPIGCKYKVFIIDEVHCISPAGWAALLKLVEEPPARTVMIFCTTNPEKIPSTILSRVQTFQLSKISLKGITDRLIHVLECEKSEGRDISYDVEAINFIAKLGQGGMRDSLTLLDKALAYSNNVTIQSLEASLNLPSYDDYFSLLSACAKHNNEAIADIINKVYNSGVNFVRWFEGFHGFVMNVVKYVLLQDIQATTIPSSYQDKISKYSSAHVNICLKLASKLMELNHELKTTQYLQEIALTYLCSPTK